MRMPIALALGLALAGGCMMPPELAPAPPLLTPVPPPRRPGNGSLFHPEVGANYPALDVRARFPGDVLTIVVAENAKGNKAVTTNGKSSSTILAKVAAFFGIPPPAALPAGFNPAQIVDAATEYTNKEEGATSRQGTLTGSVTATVTAVEPNGNLHLRGAKVVTVNREDQYLVITGMVRPEDISRDNTIASTRIADAHISFYGYGTVGDKEMVPLFQRAFAWIWPF